MYERITIILKEGVMNYGKPLSERISTIRMWECAIELAGEVLVCVQNSQAPTRWKNTLIERVCDLPASISAGVIEKSPPITQWRKMVSTHIHQLYAYITIGLNKQWISPNEYTSLVERLQYIYSMVVRFHRSQTRNHQPTSARDTNEQPQQDGESPRP